MPLQAAQDKTVAAEVAQAFLQSILDTGREPFLVLDAALHVITANRAFLQTFRVTGEETVGQFLYDLGDGQWDIPALRLLLQDIVPSDSSIADFEVSHDFPRVGPRTVLLNGRKLYRPGNHTEMLLLAIEDVSERRMLEGALEAGHIRLETTLQQMPSGVAIAEASDGRLVFHNEAAVRLLGHPFLEYGAVSGYARFGAVHADGTPYEAGEYPLARAVLAGETTVGEEMLYRRGDGTLTTLSVNAAPLRDRAGDIAGAVSTFHDISAQKQAEQEQRARAEREALINRIGRMMRASSDPEAVQAAAVRELGTALGADRALFTLFDVARDHAWIGRDFRRADLPPLAGDYRISEFIFSLGEFYPQEATRLIRDVRAESSRLVAADAFEGLGLRAALSVPIYESSRLVGNLTLGMADGPREWTAEEAALVETVAVATRNAVESARLSLREHTIATQLERALQPDIPYAVPGLRLAKYYEAALDEAGVGGDFYDVFATEKGLTFLVVGDLSGKGLDAAAQVATVRNMLRFALYNGRTVAGPVASLNRTLAENGLLTGFATLFVGRYDAGTGTLTYVNCGQEPGLLRRAASGQILELDPTGPVLGTFPEAAFTEEVVAFAPGDALALFTDGLTEAGPSRTDMLGLDGIAALLGDPPGEAGGDAAEAAERLALRLIAGVDAYAQAGVRDDVCLLVAVAA